MKQKTYAEGYYEGVIDTLNRVNKWLDEDTIAIEAVREELLK